MKKISLMLAVVCWLALLAACAGPEQVFAPEDVAGKAYTYEKEGCGGSFTISLYADGTFQYYEGMLSSYIGFGTWTLDEGNVLTLKDQKMARLQPDGTWGRYNRINCFKVEKDRLVWMAEQSDNFLYVDVMDGEAFLVEEGTLSGENPLIAHTKVRLTLDEIREIVLDLGCGEERLFELLEGYTHEETVELWGQPDTMTSGIWSHGWKLDEETLLVVFYGGDEGKITEVRITTEEK